MKLGSALAIYALFWTMTLFMVLPFGVRTAEEAGVEHQPGHAESAPHGYNFGRTMLRTTLVSAVLFGAYYLNYVNGWITAEMLDWST
jgi:predicted secreted protein